MTNVFLLIDIGPIEAHVTTYICNFFILIINQLRNLEVKHLTAYSQITQIMSLPIPKGLIVRKQDEKLLFLLFFFF